MVHYSSSQCKLLQWFCRILFSPLTGYANSLTMLQLLQMCPIITGLINRTSKKNNDSNLISLFTDVDKMHHEDKVVNLVLKNWIFVLKLNFIWGSSKSFTINICGWCETKEHNCLILPHLFPLLCPSLLTLWMQFQNVEKYFKLKLLLNVYYLKVLCSFTGDGWLQGNCVFQTQQTDAQMNPQRLWQQTLESVQVQARWDPSTAREVLMGSF